MACSLATAATMVAHGTVTTGCYTDVDGDSRAPYRTGGAGWIIGAERALELHGEGATFLDARGVEAWREGHVAGSRPVTWQQFSVSEPAARRGRLLDDDDALSSTLSSLGVRADRPVVVLGDALDGWGEDGRIVWMLRTLGHERVALLDGGWRAVELGGLPVSSGDQTSAAAASDGAFSVARAASWAVDQEQLADELAAGDEDLLLIDSRERAEYDGATPYGESRGGHVPGAIHLHYRELLGTLGYLRDGDALRAALTDRGIAADRDVVIYCTGGVRSGWLVAVFVDLGFSRVRNYAGSMWEWAAGEPERYPLTVDGEQDR